MFSATYRASDRFPPRRPGLNPATLRQIVNREMVATAGMRARLAAVVLAIVVSQASGAAQDAHAVVDEASRVMGVTGLNAIAIAGTAAYGNLGQSRTISFRLASTTIGTFTRTLDFAASAMH